METFTVTAFKRILDPLKTLLYFNYTQRSVESFSNKILANVNKDMWGCEDVEFNSITFLKSFLNFSCQRLKLFNTI